MWFNLIIAAFNLLPAFPLDGGRVFRAFLEERGLGLEQATRVAARAGRVVAVLFVAVGLVWDLWLAIIGVFVYFGAAAEEAGTIVHVRLRGRVVGDVMLLDPVVVDAAMPLAAFREVQRRTAQRAFPVVGPDGYEGVVEVVDDSRPAGTTVRDLEHHAVPVLAASDDLEASLPAVVGAPGHAVAVLDGVRVVGVLRIEEVQHMLQAPAPPPRRTAGGPP